MFPCLDYSRSATDTFFRLNCSTSNRREPIRRLVQGIFLHGRMIIARRRRVNAAQYYSVHMGQQERNSTDEPICLDLATLASYIMLQNYKPCQSIEDVGYKLLQCERRTGPVLAGRIIKHRSEMALLATQNVLPRRFAKYRINRGEKPAARGSGRCNTSPQRPCASVQPDSTFTLTSHKHPYLCSRWDRHISWRV